MTFLPLLLLPDAARCPVPPRPLQLCRSRDGSEEKERQAVGRAARLMHHPLERQHGAAVHLPLPQATAAASAAAAGNAANAFRAPKACRRSAVLFLRVCFAGRRRGPPPQAQSAPTTLWKGREGTFSLVMLLFFMCGWHSRIGSSELLPRPVHGIAALV